MAEGPHIEVAEIRAALDQCLTAVELRFVTTISLDADHYWTLDPRLAYEAHADQSEGLMLGQLTTTCTRYAR